MAGVYERKVTKEKRRNVLWRRPDNGMTIEREIGDEGYRATRFLGGKLDSLSLADSFLEIGNRKQTASRSLRTTNKFFAIAG